MKAYKTITRTGGYRTVVDENGYYMCEVWNSEEIHGTAENVIEFIEKNKPTKPSISLLNAIEKAFNENGEVRYNCGNGNQRFYFSETK